MSDGMSEGSSSSPGPRQHSLLEDRVLEKVERMTAELREFGGRLVSRWSGGDESGAATRLAAVEEMTEEALTYCFGKTGREAGGEERAAGKEENRFARRRALITAFLEESSLPTGKMRLGGEWWERIPGAPTPTPAVATPLLASREAAPHYLDPFSQEVLEGTVLSLWFARRKGLGGSEKLLERLVKEEPFMRKNYHGSLYKEGVLAKVSLVASEPILSCAAKRIPGLARAEEGDRKRLEEEALAWMVANKEQAWRNVELLLSGPEEYWGVRSESEKELEERARGEWHRRALTTLAEGYWAAARVAVPLAKLLPRGIARAFLEGAARENLETLYAVAGRLAEEEGINLKPERKGELEDRLRKGLSAYLEGVAGEEVVVGRMAKKVLGDVTLLLLPSWSSLKGVFAGFRKEKGSGAEGEPGIILLMRRVLESLPAYVSRQRAPLTDQYIALEERRRGFAKFLATKREPPFLSYSLLRALAARVLYQPAVPGSDRPGPPTYPPPELPTTGRA